MIHPEFVVEGAIAVFVIVMGNLSLKSEGRKKKWAPWLIGLGIAAFISINYFCSEAKWSLS